MRILAALSLLAVSACATLSAIQPVGPDTFSVLATATELTQAHDKALAAAKAHCDGLSRELLVVKSRAQAESYEAVFRCLPAGDPELRRPE